MYNNVKFQNLAKDFLLEQINKTILPNGVKIVSEYIPYLRSFSLGFWVNTGSKNETLSNNGVSHFIEHMLFKGTQKRSAKKISEDIESKGGYLNAFTTKEHTCYYGRGLTNNFELTFEVISDMIQNPLFREKDIKKESTVVIDELYDIEDNPEELIFDKFESELYKGNSLEFPIIGTVENLEQFTQKDLFDYTKKYYASNNLTIALSGAIEHNKLVDIASKYLSQMTKSKIGKSKSIKLKKTNEVKIIKDIQQCHLILGAETYGIKDKERTALALLAQILGEGSSSRLFQVLRERNGITYQANSFFNSFFDTSSIGVYLSTNEKSFEKAEILALRELEKLKAKKISLNELNRAKEYIIGTLLMSYESTTSRMNRLGASEIYINRVKTIDEIVNEVKQITVEDILIIANEAFNQDKILRVVIVPK